jgi:hypothetical protein
MAESRDGREFLEKTAVDQKDLKQRLATLYSSTSIRIGDLQLPPGMYSLEPFPSPEGVSLIVSKQIGEWNADPGTRRFIGSIGTKPAPIEGLPEPRLAVAFKPTHLQAPMSADVFDHELHFVWGGTDVFVNIRQDRRW